MELFVAEKQDTFLHQLRDSTEKEREVDPKQGYLDESRKRKRTKELSREKTSYHLSLGLWCEPTLRYLLQGKEEVLSQRLLQSKAMCAL